MKNPSNDDKPKKKSRKILLILLAILLLLVVGGALLFWGMSRAGRDAVLPKEENLELSVPDLPEFDDLDIELEDDGKTVTYGGKTYTFNEHVTSILFMGVDREEMYDAGVGIEGSRGQADCLFLLTWNLDNGQMKLVSISRDTMVDVSVYDINGNLHSVQNQQLCLAYSYGDGQEGSCENVVRSVERLLYGVPIQSYAAINLSAISDLNDAIGGVEVYVPNDPCLNPSDFEYETTMLLMGELAEAFVRNRDADRLDSNIIRVARQKQYLLGFIQKALQMTKADLTVPVKLYKVAMANMVTDIDLSKVTYLATQVTNLNFTEGNMMSLPGENIQGEIYAEFHVDDKAVYEFVLDTFYTVVD